MTPEDQKAYDALKLAYDEYCKMIETCGTYEAALKWIERASTISSDMWELKHGPLSISAK